MTELKNLLIKYRKKCASREKCSHDILEELVPLVGKELAEKVLEHLISEKFVDNARFAKMFASEKHRLNKWGRVKIRYFLQFKRIEAENINAALFAIDNALYEKNALDEIEKKIRLLRAENMDLKWEKISQFMYSKGYEPEVTTKILSRLLKTD